MTRKSLTERVPDRIEAWVALVLCGAVLVAALVQWLVPSRPAYAEVFAPDWIALPAAVVAGLSATATMRGDHPPSPPRRVLYWSGCLLMTWASGGLLLDLLRVVGLWLPIIPPVVDWPGMVTRALALAASVVLAHLTLFRPPRESGGRAPSWFGWVAFVLALTYPLLKTWWAMGGTLGLSGGGVAGELIGSFALWLPSIPWLLAAILSLLLVPTWRRIPRWMLLTAGWVATAIAANVGPAACWALVTAKVSGSPGPEGIATWVVSLFYGSWLLFAIAIGAATRSYQLRSAAPRQSETDLGHKGGGRDGDQRNAWRNASDGRGREDDSPSDHQEGYLPVGPAPPQVLPRDRGARGRNPLRFGLEQPLGLPVELVSVDPGQGAHLHAGVGSIVREAGNRITQTSQRTEDPLINGMTRDVS